MPADIEKLITALSDVLWYRTFEDEVNKTVKFVKGLKAKYPNKSIGILVPYNSQLSQVSKVL